MCYYLFMFLGCAVGWVAAYCSSSKILNSGYYLNRCLQGFLQVLQVSSNLWKTRLVTLKLHLGVCVLVYGALQVVFPPHTQCPRDRLRIHRNLEKDEVSTESQWTYAEDVVQYGVSMQNTDIGGRNAGIKEDMKTQDTSYYSGSSILAYCIWI